MENKTMLLSEIPVESTFKIGSYEFIKFEEKDDKVIAVSRDVLFHSRFGSNNNFASSTILEKLEPVLKEVEAIVGSENVLEFETDLISIDGSKKHGTVTGKISLPTFDFYREHRDTFEKFKVESWWWLATPWETSEYTNDSWVACVSPSGFLLYYHCRNDDYGVRPFWIFSSSISVSCEE